MHIVYLEATALQLTSITCIISSRTLTDNRQRFQVEDNSEQQYYYTFYMMFSFLNVYVNYFYHSQMAVTAVEFPTTS